MTNKKIFAGITIATIFTISMMLSPAIAQTMGFLDIDEAEVEIKDDSFEKAKIETQDKIPRDGSGGAFGFGIISGAGLEAIAVATTHAGVLDSEAQANAADPVFHNHYVALQMSSDGTGLCQGLEVRDITFEEPGDVKVSSDNAKMEDVPFSFSGTHSLAGTSISFLADENVGAVVSFTIDPVDGTGITNPNDIQAVCINDVKPAAELETEIND